MRPGGNKFGKYRLIERRENVAVGEAYCAKLVGMAGFEKRVELWCFARTLWGDPALFESAMREAARGALLSHANIAQVLDVGTVGGVSFVATEHVAGPTLEDVLRRQGTLAWPVAAYIAGEVAAGLSYVHRAEEGQRRAPSLGASSSGPWASFPWSLRRRQGHRFWNPLGLRRRERIPVPRRTPARTGGRARRRVRAGHDPPHLPAANRSPTGTSGRGGASPRTLSGAPLDCSPRSNARWLRSSTPGTDRWPHSALTELAATGTAV